MIQNLYFCKTLEKDIVMDLAARKFNFIERLIEVDENLMTKLEAVLKTGFNSKDWFKELSAKEQSEIEIGLQQANDNKLVDHKKVMDKFTKWH